MEGWLKKEGRIYLFYPTITKRWFALSQNPDTVLLQYFTDQTRSIKKGEYMLDVSSTIRIKSSNEGYYFVLSSRTGRLVMIADSEARRNEWMLVLTNTVRCLSVRQQRNDDVCLGLQHLIECQQAITEKWSELSSGKTETISTYDRVQNVDGSFNLALRQQNLRGEPVETIDELYDAAAVTLPAFELTIHRIVAEFEIDFRMAPLKENGRAVEKAKDDYDERERGHGERWLFDIVRGFVLCNTEEQLVRTMDALLRSKDIDIVRLKNRFATPTPCGFRDFIVNIRVPLNEKAFHICELQVHCAVVKEMDTIKLSYKIYEYFRIYLRGDKNTVDERFRLLQEVAGSSALDRTALGAIIEAALSSNELSHLNNIEALLELLSEYEHNILIHSKIIIVEEEQNGIEHPSTMAAVVNLANLLNAVYRRAEARALYDRALRGYENTLGPDHFLTLQTIVMLADLLKSLGERQEARGLYERALRGKEAALGTEHPSTLIAVNNLANFFVELGEMAEARALFERALRGKEKVLGPEDLSTLHTVNNFAVLLKKIGERAKARSLYERALRGYLKVRGPEHLGTLNTMNNLANLLLDEGQNSKARALYERVLLGYSKIYGPNHPETLRAVSMVGALSFPSLGTFR